LHTVNGVPLIGGVFHFLLGKMQKIKTNILSEDIRMDYITECSDSWRMGGIALREFNLEMEYSSFISRFLWAA
jgi:hypothetical protein